MKDPSEDEVDPTKKQNAKSKDTTNPLEKENKGSVDTEEKTATSSEGKNPDAEETTKSTSKTATDADNKAKEPYVDKEQPLPEVPKVPNTEDTDQEKNKEANAGSADPDQKVPDSPVNTNPKPKDDTKTVVEVGNGGNDEKSQAPEPTDKDTSKSTSKAEANSGSSTPKTESKGSSNEEKTETNKSTGGKRKTYREYIDSLDENKGKNILWVDEKTYVHDLKNIMLQKMHPQYRRSFVWHEDQMFKGSPSIHFFGEWHNNGKKKMYILKKHTDEEAEKLRKACIEALKKEKPDDEKDKVNKQVYKIKYWCSVPTVRDVLEKNKFKLATTNDDWKQILKGELFTNEQYWKKHSMTLLMSESERNLLRISSESCDQVKISILQDFCEKFLSRKFWRERFPATRDFLPPGKFADNFQELALFCTVPITAEQYVTTNMKREVIDKIPEEWSDDYCYIQGWGVEHYKKIKTTDSMKGKGFWCAVRMLYQKQDEPDKKHEHSL